MGFGATDLSFTAQFGAASLAAVTVALLGLGLARWLGGRRWARLKSYRPTSGRLDRLAVVGDGLKTHRIQLEVIYRVEGDRLVCTRHSPGRQRFTTEAAARTALGDLVEGATIALWYDPKNPALSCVCRQRPGPGPILLLSLWLLLGLGVLGGLAVLFT